MSKSFFFTINNPEEVDLTKYWNAEEFTIMIGQLEEGEQGTRHLQFILRTHKNKRFSFFQKLWPKCHVEECKDWKAAEKYCTKEEGRVAGPWKFRARGSGGDHKSLNVKQWMQLTEEEKLECSTYQYI